MTQVTYVDISSQHHDCDHNYGYQSHCEDNLSVWIHFHGSQYYPDRYHQFLYQSRNSCRQ